MNQWLTASWGVLCQSSRSHKWWSSQTPQMCRSLLSPQKQSDDLEKQRHVNSTACVKHSRWYHCHNTNSTARRSSWYAGYEYVLEDERGNYICSDSSTALVERYGWNTAKSMPELILTCARQDRLIVFSREQGTGLDLSETGIQVHSGRCRNTRPIFTLHPGADKIGNTAVYQNANIL